MRRKPEQSVRQTRANSSCAGPVLDNFTRVPNGLFDCWLSDLSGAELKVLLYLCRRIYGFHKNGDRVGIPQIRHGITAKDGTVLDRGTGLHTDTIIAALDSLKLKGLVAFERRNGVRTRYIVNLSELSGKSGKVETQDSPPELSGKSGKVSGCTPNANLSGKSGKVTFPEIAESCTFPDFPGSSKERSSSERKRETKGTDARAAGRSGKRSAVAWVQTKAERTPAQNDDDDSNRLANRRPLTVDRVTSDPEAKRLVRQMIATGPELNVDNVVRQVEKILNGRATWTNYWEHIQTCTTPRLAAGGHYVEQAKRVGIQEAGPALDIWAPVKDTPRNRCEKCGGGGMATQNETCDCPMGLELAAIRVRRKASELAKQQEPSTTSGDSANADL